MSCKLEPAIWSRGQRMACYDRCQLIIAGMSNIKEVHGKLRLYVSFLEYGRHVGQLRRRRLRRRRRRRRRAYAPTSNTASQDNHEKMNSWVSFSFPCMLSMGLRLGALRAAGAPLLIRAIGFSFFSLFRAQSWLINSNFPRASRIQTLYFRWYLKSYQFAIFLF